MKKRKLLMIPALFFLILMQTSGRAGAQVNLWRHIALGDPMTENGMQLVNNADGLWRTTQLGGQSCVQMTPNNVSRAAGLYFAVEDSYIFDNAFDVFITVEYFDRGEGTFAIEYDDGAEAYKHATDVVVNGSNQWLKKTITLPKVGFGNRQAHGADFRLVVADTTKMLLAVKYAAVWKAPGNYIAPVHEDFSGESFSSDDELVFTYYFYWYDSYSGAHIWDNAQHTDDALQDHPPTLENFSFKSVEWHKRELRDMMDAGIDVLIPVYWGAAQMMQSWSVEGLQNLVLAEQELIAEGLHPPKIGLFFDTSTLQAGEYVLRAENAPVDLATSFGKAFFFKHIRDFYSLVPPELWARIDNRPVVWLYAAAFAKNVNQGLVSYVHEHFQTAFPSLQPYIVRETSWNIATANDYAWGAALSGAKILGVASVGPGYNDSAVPGRTTPITDRENGDFYQKNWQTVLGSGRNFVIIETWNELHEGTDICNSKEYGRRYIDMTAGFVRAFKQSTKFFSFAPTGWTGTVQPACRVQVQDKQNGLQPSTVGCEYSEDRGKTWRPWAATCSGDVGTKDVEMIQVSDIPFSQSALMETQNYARFSIVNAVGDTMISPPFGVKNGTAPDFRAEIVLGESPAGEGISQSNYQSDDGWSATTVIGGRPCVYNLVDNASPYPGRYLYFNVADSLIFAASHPNVWIAIDYYDTSATGKIELQYDSRGSELSQKYKNGGAVVALHSGAWKSAVFHLTDAWFANRENGLSDFRFYCGGVMFLSRVSVSSTEPTGVASKRKDEPAAAPAQFNLLQNVPNPFNQSTKIEYELAQSAHVLLTIYDVNGRKVTTLVNEEKNSGRYMVAWAGASDSGPVSSGLYLAVLSVKGGQVVRRLLLIK